MPTTTRGRKAPEKAADEAQAEPIEGEVVNEEKQAAEAARTQRTADMLAQLRTVLMERVRAEVNPKLAELRTEVDGLAEAVAAAGNGAGQMLEEDALNDRLDGIVETRLKVLYGEEGSATAATLTERVDNLAGSFQEYQLAINDRLRDLAKEFGDALGRHQEAQVARLEAASAHGVLRDVIAEHRAAVPGVYRKVHQLMLEVTQIGKDREFKAETRGNNSNKIEYTFRGIDDAMDAVGAALRTVGLIMRSEVVKAEYTVNEVPRFWQGKQEGVTLWATTRLTMRYTFIDPEDGTEHSVEGYGVGKDNGDKDGSKSSAAAMKYALFQGLCIPVKGMNIDPEDDHPTGETTLAERRARAEEEHHDDTPPPPDDTPPPDPDHAFRRATAALAAARDPQKTRTQADITAILAQGAKEKILSTEVEGQTLQAWLIGIRRTIGTGE